MMDHASETTAIPMAVRGYIKRAKGGTGSRRDRSFEPYSPWTLVLDTETDTEELPAAQPLLIVQYRIYYERQLFQRGVAYDPETAWPEEVKTIKEFCLRRRYYCLTANQFRSLFYWFGFDLQATIVGANPFFDISRLAVWHVPARNSMYGGFSFVLLHKSPYPNVRAKKLTDIAYKFDFAGPPAAPIKHSQRFQESDVRPPPMRGTFVDVLVLGKALLGEGRPSLAILGKKLQVRHPKLKVPEFSRPITEEQLRYAVRDPLTTAQCYFELKRRYAALELPTPLHRIYSEASVAKGYLDKMSILPWRQVQPNVDPTIIGYLMSTYVAGRTDTKIRREIRRDAVCDFTALYPTGCVRLGLWKFIIAQGFECLEATDDVQAFLNSVSLDDLQRPQTWPKMVGIAQIHANGDVLPIRGRYGRRPGRRIGWNHFSQRQDDHLIWVTTLDLVASKILTGRAAKIVRGLTFSPLTPQDGLQTITLAGGFKFDPYTDDFFKVVNEQRIAVNTQLVTAKETGDSDLVDRLDGTQRHLKTVANAIYGFFEEQNIEERKRAVEHIVYSMRGQEPRHRWLKSIEKPGKFFQPLLGTCITAAAHLFLAIAEHLAEREGIEWMFCDTDSMAFVRPIGMDDATFLAKVEAIRRWFAPLNPYKGLPDDDLFKIEKVNFELDGKTPRELFGLAIAPKSYCLFTLDKEGAPIIQEGKQHGLGHLLPPYTRSDEEEKGCLKATKLRCWQRDVWELIVRAHLEGHPDIVDYGKLENFAIPAAHRFTVSTIKTDNYCEHFNEARPYRERIRPGGFLVSLSTKNPARLQGKIGVPVRAEDARKDANSSVYAPYDKDIRKAATAGFDRKTGKPIPIEMLKTFAEALRYFHVRPQDKYEGGKYLDTGTVRRRHVMPLWFDIIGKEVRRFSTEDPEVFDEEFSPTEYGSIASLSFLHYAASVLGCRGLAKARGIPLRRVDELLFGRLDCAPNVIQTIKDLVAQRLEQNEGDRRLIERARQYCVECGSLRKAALNLSVAAANLSRLIRGCVSLTPHLRKKLEFIREEQVCSLAARE